jgi:hypothetical protein
LALGHSPRIVMDGLVLCLDGANYKSFKGEATTNYYSTPITLTSGRTGSTDGSIKTSFNTGGPTGGPFTRVVRDTSVSRTTDWEWQIGYSGTGLSNGNSFVVSFYARCPNGTLSSVKLSNPDVEGQTFNIDSTWRRFTASFTYGAQGGLTFFRVNRGHSPFYTNGATYDIANLQVEAKSYSTSFVDGTRGTTVATGGGWKDLVGSTDGTIVNGVRESSNNGGCLTLDGTNDYVSFSYPSINVNGPYTIIQWIRPSSALVAGGSGANKPGGANRRTSIVGPGPAWNPGIWMTSDYLRVHAKTQYRDAAINWTTTTWNMIGMTYDGTNCGIIYGGEFMSIAHTTAYAPSNPTTLYIGAENSTGNGFNWLGDVGMTMFYNKVLSAAEVKQNFDAHKGRYGL